jgi:coupling of ubiquitin conjugation to ER degradation protein 1
MADATEQINVPSLVVILVLSGLIIRYLFFSPPPSSSSAAAGAAGAGAGTLREREARAREAAAERVLQMFPQVDRRTALWDLQRNGGNVAATTERILAGRMEVVSVPCAPSSVIPHRPFLLALLRLAVCKPGLV